MLLPAPTRVFEILATPPVVLPVNKRVLKVQLQAPSPTSLQLKHMIHIEIHLLLSAPWTRAYAANIFLLSLMLEGVISPSMP